MRDFERIDRILRKVGLLWSLNPDLRFGQLLINHGIVDDSSIVWNNSDDGFELHLESQIASERLIKRSK